MFKKISICLLLLTTIYTFSQEGTSSPYSYFGIGDVRFRGTIDNRSMGDVSVIPDSIHINLINPAMLSNIKYTTFTASGTFSPVRFKTETDEEKAQRTTIDYISIVLPAKRFCFGFGLMPYSSVGYNILNSNSDFLYTFRGKGGVNRVYSSVAFKLNKQFNFGVDILYNFGRIETTNTTTSTAETLTRELNTSSINGFSFNFGLSHQMKVFKKLTLASGLTFTPEADVDLVNTRNIAIIRYNSLGQEEIFEDIDVVVPNSNLKLPSKITFGTSIGELKKWVVGVQVTSQQTSGLSNRIQDLSNVSFENALKFSIGGYYIPKYSSFTSYLSRMTYRAGLRYENTGLIINNLSILDRAITLGIGFPLGGTFSNLNVGLELGKRGTKNAGLIEENYSNISVAFSFNDRWFLKRQFN